MVAEEFVVGELEAEGVAEVHDCGWVGGGGEMGYVGAHRVEVLLRACDIAIVGVEGAFEAVWA